MSNSISNFGTDSTTAAIGAKVEGKAADKTTVNRVSVTGIELPKNVNVTTATPNHGTFAATQIHGGFGAELP